MTDNSPENPQVKPVLTYHDLEILQLIRRACDEERARLPRWQPIETAPQDGTWVLLFGDGVGFASCHTVGYYGFGSRYERHLAQWRRASWLGEPISPLYWMPLPEPPKEYCIPEPPR